MMALLVLLIACFSGFRDLDLEGLRGKACFESDGNLVFVQISDRGTRRNVRSGDTIAVMHEYGSGALSGVYVIPSEGIANKLNEGRCLSQKVPDSSFGELRPGWHSYQDSSLERSFLDLMLYGYRQASGVLKINSFYADDSGFCLNCGRQNKSVPGRPFIYVVVFRDDRGGANVGYAMRVTSESLRRKIMFGR